MNQTESQTVEKQGWMMRLITAVCEKCLTWICQSEISMSPSDAQTLLYFSGFSNRAEWEEAMIVKSLARMNWDEGV